MESLIPDYLQALKLELRLVGESANERLPVHTIFFGGGTPSILVPEFFQELLDEIAHSYQLLENLEISLEANPGTVSLEKMSALRKIGFNRLSLGVQSFRPDELRFLGRIHTVQEVFQAYAWARQAGFDNINLDLIYGLPDQTQDQWRESLEHAIRLAPEHLSLYSLTVEEGTPLYDWVGRGLVGSPDDDLAADQYELAEVLLEQYGFCHYEISNWAQSNKGSAAVCLHNLQYWRALPYLGFGAGAHGFAKEVRTANVSAIPDYISRCKSGSLQPFPAGPAAAQVNPLNIDTQMQEFMLVGLRLLEEGVSRLAFFSRFGRQLQDVFPEQVDRLIRKGLLEQKGDILRLSPAAHFIANRAFMEFVGD